MKQHPWEKEYSEQKLVSLGETPSEDAKRFLKWLKKDRKIDLGSAVVLDTGCGNGKNGFLFAENGARVVGYDVARNVIALAQARAMKEGWQESQIKFFVHNMKDSLNLPDNSVDIVLDITSSNALTTPEREKYLQETFRVLKSGGYVFVRTLCKDGDENAKHLIKNFPGPEKDMYKLVGTDIVERAFTREDLLATYEPYGKILHLERIFHYPKFEGRIYKRAYWIMYLLKN
jgi:ubiquinone/menaquinone biosynthesis C-methylase UbiE